LTGDGVDRNDICLFAVDNVPKLRGDVGLDVIVEDLLQSKHVYYTIRHPTLPNLTPLRSGSSVWAGDTIWNIPIPYRPMTDKERIDIEDWVNELKGYPASVPADQKSQEYWWDSLQLLLHFLGKGKTWAKADGEVKLKKQSQAPEVSARYEVYREWDKEAERMGAEAGENVVPRPITRWGPSPEYTSGDHPITY
jgi:hypothetical protein